MSATLPEILPEKLAESLPESPSCCPNPPTALIREQARENRAPRNRTIRLSPEEQERLAATLLESPSAALDPEELNNRIIRADLHDVLEHLPESFVDVLFIDPPYNLTKNYGASVFRERSLEEYARWFDSWFSKLLKTLKENASVYVCCDWRCSSAVHSVLERHLNVRNRITWEREKGRGSMKNWKNCSEDIWFCTTDSDYVFNVDQVKLKRRVIAPYTNRRGEPRDWDETDEGRFRLTHPSNLWTDITVPFWSMPENTEHPTQKPEKLLAKVILASSNEGDLVFDPFLGSGTAAVAAAKLGRRFVGVEREPEYALLAAKRLEMAAANTRIQGYRQGVFWERNSGS